MKRWSSEWEKIIANETTDKRYYTNYTSSLCNAISEKQLNQKWAEDLNRHSSKEDIQSGQQIWKNAQHCSLLEKCKSKPPWGITSHLLEWLPSQSLQTINVRQNVEKREPSCIVGGNVNGYSHYGEQYGDYSKN